MPITQVSRRAFPAPGFRPGGARGESAAGLCHVGTRCRSARRSNGLHLHVVEPERRARRSRLRARTRPERLPVARHRLRSRALRRVRFSSKFLGGQPLPRLPIRALHITQLGTLWVGFGGTGGLARIDNRVVTPLVTPGSPDFAGPVNALSEGLAHFGCQPPLVSCASRTRSGERVGAGDGIGTDGPVTGYVDGTGALWVSASNGLFRRPSADAVPSNRSSQPPIRFWTLAFSEDQNGRVWAADIGVGFRALGPGPDVRGRDAARGYRLLHDRVGHLWSRRSARAPWRVDQPDATKGAVSVQRATVLTDYRAMPFARSSKIATAISGRVPRKASTVSPHRVTPFADIGLVTTIDSTTDGRVGQGTADALVSFAVNGNEWRHRQTHIGCAASQRFADRPPTVCGRRHPRRSSGYEVTQRRHTPPANGKRITLDAPHNRRRRRRMVVTSAGEVLKTERGELHAVAQLTELNGARQRRTPRQHGTPLGHLRRHEGRHARHRWSVSRLPEASVGAGTHYDLFEDAAGTIWTSGAGTASPGLQTDTFSRSALRADSVWRHLLHHAGRAPRPLDGHRRRHRPYGSGRVRSRDYLPRLHRAAPGFTTPPMDSPLPRCTRRPERQCAHDGTLWFVTSRGITMANPRRLNTRRPATLVGIDAIRADDEPVTANELRPGTTKLEIDYTAPELTSLLKTRFRHRLEGFDND